MFVLCAGNEQRSVIDTSCDWNDWNEWNEWMVWPIATGLWNACRFSAEGVENKCTTEYQWEFQWIRFCVRCKMNIRMDYGLWIAWFVWIEQFRCSQPFFNVAFLLLYSIQFDSFCFVCSDTDKRLSFILTWCTAEMCACCTKRTHTTSQCHQSIDVMFVLCSSLGSSFSAFSAFSPIYLCTLLDECAVPPVSAIFGANITYNIVFVLFCCFFFCCCHSANTWKFIRSFHAFHHCLCTFISVLSFCDCRLFYYSNMVAFYRFVCFAL